MTAPLLITGPGGDYVTRFDVKGDGLVKTRAQQSAGHDRDSESAGNGVAWGFLGRRKKKAQAKATRPLTDRFEHTEPATLPATYAKPALAEPQQQFAMIQAIKHWLESQQAELGRLAAIQTATEADLAQGSFALAAQPAELASASGSASGSANNSTTTNATNQSSPVRVIRFNSTTMDLPTPAPTLVPEPCHAFATTNTDAEAETTSQQTDPTQTQRSVEHDQPQPHAQANENFDINSRHPAIARLFADDERARRSARRLQGHHLRARRSTDQKGLPSQGCEQSTLFGAVA